MCGSARLPTDRSIPTGSITTGVSSGTTAIARSGTRAYTCSTWFHYNWRFFWDYGNSEIGNQGVHVLDLAMWGIQSMRGLHKCLPKRVASNGGIYWLDDAKEVPDTQVVTYDYGDFMLVWELRS